MTSDHPSPRPAEAVLAHQGRLAAVCVRPEQFMATQAELWNTGLSGGDGDEVAAPRHNLARIAEDRRV